MSATGIPQPDHAPIAPVSPGLPRPRWSVMIPTYNCARYLGQTLASVLAQDPGPNDMQIEVIDDHSTRDDPEAVAREVGRGRVSFYQQPQNVGHVRNFETCLQRARGHLIHQLHGDDYVREGFYQRLGAAFAARPEIGAAYCRQIITDEDDHWRFISGLERQTSGLIDDWITCLIVRPQIQTPAVVVRRSVYEALGGFDRRLLYNEDIEMWARIAAHDPVWYEVQPLAVYRLHSTSNSARYLQSGEAIQDRRRCLAVLAPLLPAARFDEIRRAAFEHTSLWSITAARECASRGDFVAAWTILRQAWRLRRCRRVAAAALRVLWKFRIGFAKTALADHHENSGHS